MLKQFIARAVLLGILMGSIVGHVSWDDSTIDLDPDVGLNVIQLVKKYRYPFKSYVLLTKDEYILSLHRITQGLVKTDRRGTVLLVPGLLCSSVDWLNTGPKSGLGFLLADAGYDVWMMNPRGTTWSRKHNYYDPDRDKEKFWNFSWHEIGLYDLSACIDYVLKKTNKKQLHIVAHSQGATAFFVLASMLPDYNKKIKLMIALAPIAYMSRLPNVFFRLLAKPKGATEEIGKLVGTHEFKPHRSLIPAMGQDSCDGNTRFTEVCTNPLFLIAGYDTENLDPDKIGVILSNLPAGASIKQFVHYIHVIRSKDQFIQYDYGEVENIKRYGTPLPARYKLSSVTAPVAIYYGMEDQLATPAEVSRLHDMLDNVVVYKKVDALTFHHLDFLWAKDVVRLLYKDVINKMNEYP